jgi:hypothetical protein
MNQDEDQNQLVSFSRAAIDRTIADAATMLALRPMVAKSIEKWAAATEPRVERYQTELAGVFGDLPSHTADELMGLNAQLGDARIPLIVTRPFDDQPTVFIAQYNLAHEDRLGRVTRTSDLPGTSPTPRYKVVSPDGKSRNIEVSGIFISLDAVFLSKYIPNNNKNFANHGYFTERSELSAASVFSQLSEQTSEQSLWKEVVKQRALTAKREDMTDCFYALSPVPGCYMFDASGDALKRFAKANSNHVETIAKMETPQEVYKIAKRAGASISIVTEVLHDIRAEAQGVATILEDLVPGVEMSLPVFRPVGYQMPKRLRAYAPTD